MKKLYHNLQKRLGKIEIKLFELTQKSKERNYFSNMYSYLMLGFEYLFFGLIEAFLKLFILLTKTPEESYRILTAPIEQFEFSVDELKQREDFHKHCQFHKSVRKFSFVSFASSLVAVLVVSLVVIYLFPKSQTSLGASYTWTQTDWSGGPSTQVAIHPTNQTGWTYFTSTSTGVQANSSGISLKTDTYTFTDATSTSGPATVTGGGFNNGTLTNTNITINGEIKLLSVFECGDNITDIDGNTYKTAPRGTLGLCWMEEPLKVTRKSDGTAVTTKCPNGDCNNVAQYGLLYQWGDARTSCPSGWRLPTASEWNDRTFKDPTSSPVYPLSGFFSGSNFYGFGNKAHAWAYNDYQISSTRGSVYSLNSNSNTWYWYFPEVHFKVDYLSVYCVQP